MKKSVLAITGTRAEYGLLRPVMQEIKKSRTLELRLLVTGMHTLKRHGHTIDLVKKDFTVDAVVPVKEKDSMTDALGKEITGIGAYCRTYRPDLILVLGDRDESFAGAIVGGHLGIPVAHIHGGDKTGYVVDEYIRHATTKFAHLHFPATKLSASRIKQLGEEPWRIYMAGGPGLDELRTLKTKPIAKVAKKYNLTLKEPWYVVLHHPASLDTTAYQDQVRPLLQEMAKLPGEKLVLYPNADTGNDVFIDEINAYKNDPSFHIFPNVPRVDLIAVLKHAKLLIGNSSMGIIDASYLKLPTVNVGTRQAGRERGGNVIDCGYDVASIRRAIAKALSPAFVQKAKKSKSPYGDGRASQRIVKAIEKTLGRPGLFYKRLTYV